jgi:hypothetical protein
VLTAEKVKRMLEQTQSDPRDGVVSFVGRTHQRAMLRPQMDFISKHVALDVPIHAE